MTTGKRQRSLRALAIFATVGLLTAFAAKAGQFLVLDTPQPADAILVLAGEADHRPDLALHLLAHGSARRLILDVPSNIKLYAFTQIDLAEKYIQGLPQAAQVSVCPIQGLSTRDEAKDAAKCLLPADARILIVTSDYHTRRALDIFKREIPGHTWSVAASRDEQQYGEKWWSHRQWAKTFTYEWLRLLWWEGVDRWR